MSFIIYNGEDPSKYLTGKSIFIIAHTESCGNCVIAKSKVEILSKSYPFINFVFWDTTNFPNLESLVPGFTPIAFPYVRSYLYDKCLRGRYSAETYIIEDMIEELYKEEKENCI